MALGLISRLFDRRSGRDALVPLYTAVVGAARQPHWYLDGGVPDTRDGRFEMITTLLAFVMIRIEREGERGARDAALLTEVFVDDMDGQLREDGVGDVVVGKHVGRMMSALGGRMAAYRDADESVLRAALIRNFWPDEAPPEAALAHVATRLQAFSAALEKTVYDALIAGQLPS